MAAKSSSTGIASGTGIVEASNAAGVTVCEVARRYAIEPSQLFHWRTQFWSEPRVSSGVIQNRRLQFALLGKRSNGRCERKAAQNAAGVWYQSVECGRAESRT